MPAGAPEMVIEILSLGNTKTETKYKKELYEENGVREYLIFDPNHQNVFQFHLTDEGIYSPATIYVDDDMLQSVIFPDLIINLKEVFESN